jgi:sugar lactone lactonase YvrE
MIGRITPAGAVTEFPVPSSDGTSLNDLIVGPDGNLWFTESAFGSGGTSGPAAVGRITPSGAVTTFPLPSTEDGIAGALTVGPHGDLWFPEFHELRAPQKIGRITPAGVLTEFRLPARYGPPSDLTVGPDGDLWFTTFANSGHGGAVGRITPAGAITEFSVPTAADISPGELTVGPDGNLWFSGYPAKRSRYSTIDRITPAGSFTQFRVPTAGINPGDLTVGPDGNLWVPEYATSGTGAVGRITPAGAITEFSVPTAGISPGEPTVGPDGDLWFPVFPVGLFDTGTDGMIGRVDPTPPRVTGVLAVTNSRRVITSILLGFDEALDPGAAERVGFYSLTSGVERGHQFVFSKGVKIARVSYDATARIVALELAGPQKRTIRVKVRAGLVAADGMSSFRDFTAVVA